MEVSIESSALENLIQYYHDKKLAHAYLISTNNIAKCYEVLLKVIKNIFCVNEYVDNCNKCSLCHLIDVHNLPSLKVIEPDGTFIKKEQILELKYLFSKDSQYTKENIYIIKNAEKMNKESANTMLKFLEEPDGDVIGFFITNNKDNVISTIVSRCQNIDVNFTNSDFEELGLNEEEYNNYLDTLNDYLTKIEMEKSKLILYNKECLGEYTKDDIKILMQMALKKYKEALNNKILGKEIKDNLLFLDKLNINNLKKKVNLLIDYLKELTYNVNLDLLLDKFVIEMEAINNESL